MMSIANVAMYLPGGAVSEQRRTTTARLSCASVDVRWCVPRRDETGRPLHTVTRPVSHWIHVD